MLAFPDTVFANGEQIQFTGLVHLVIQAIPQEPTLPQEPTRIHTNLIGVTGVGLTSGATYWVTGAQQFEFSDPVSNTYAFIGSYKLRSRLLPQDPFIPQEPMRLRFRIGLNSDGTVSEAAVGTPTF